MATANAQQTGFSTPEESQVALELYKRILNFNCVGKYDPKLKQIIHITAHAVLYKFDQATDNWEQTDFQGPLVFYERSIDADLAARTRVSNEELKLKDLYGHGLMILNRNAPKNLAIGIISKNITQNNPEFYQGLHYELQEANDLLMIKTTVGEVYGIWIHNQEDRKAFAKLIKYSIEG